MVVMVNFKITHYGVSDVAKASSTPYDENHISDFIDVWLHHDPAFGIDHLFYENGEIELRVMGRKLNELIE